jgi:hypothetical protein
LFRVGIITFIVGFPLESLAAIALGLKGGNIEGSKVDFFLCRIEEARFKGPHRFLWHNRAF